MKKIIYLLSILIGFLLISCEKEQSETVNQNPVATLSKASALTSLLMRVAQNPTAFDNVIDGCNGFSVQLPVNITINEHALTVASPSDFATVAAYKSEHSNDSDVVHFIFPITIIYKNFQHELITTTDQLELIIQSCNADMSFNEINCINVNYPILVNSYDTLNQVPKTTTIHTDIECYNYFVGLNSTTIYSLVYPLSLQNLDGQSVTITNNAALKLAIDTAVLNCSDPSGSNLSDVIVSGSWHVSYLSDEGHDETVNYAAYSFTFASNGIVVAVKNAVPTNGNWNIHADGTNTKLNLGFTASNLHDFSKDWIVLEHTTTEIHLTHNEGGGEGQHLLHFTKN